MNREKLKEITLTLIICLGLTGCASLNTVRTTNRENLIKLNIGMMKQKVMEIMGTERKITYQFAGILTPFTAHAINNPYRSEVLQGKDKTFEVLYYYTDIKKRDGAITDDELLPIVFDENKLIGWGWSFLQDNINKYEIRIR